MNDKEQASVDKLKKSLDNWAQITVANTESKLSKGMLRGVLDTSSLVDQFATWLLAASGATSVLLVSNLDKIIKHIGEANFRYALSCVCISMAFGVLQKVVALQIIIHRKADAAGEVLADKINEEHERTEEKIKNMAEPHGLKINTEINISKVFASVIEAYPKIFRKKVTNLLLKVIDDPMYTYKCAIRNYFIQSTCSLLEIFAFILFIITIVQGI